MNGFFALCRRALLFALLLASSWSGRFATAAAEGGDVRRWIVRIRPTRQLSRLAPEFLGGEFEVELYRGGDVVVNGALLDGHWHVQEHPYELLDKLYDKLAGQFYSGDLTLDVTCRLWDRCFPTRFPRKVTHGVVTLNSTPRLVLATLDGRELSE
jgi:hypothetical protein